MNRLVKFNLINLLVIGWSFTSIAYGDTDESCFMCHREGVNIIRDEKEISLFVDPKVLKKSAHYKLSCLQCHPDATGIPHEKKLKAVNCQQCHSDIARECKKGTHGKVISCINCHGKHNIRSLKTASLQEKMWAIGCSDCHKKETQSYLNSIHGKGLKANKPNIPFCETCHGRHGIMKVTNPESLTYGFNLVKTCIKCHKTDGYEKSAHYQAVKAGKKGAICSDCHGSHEIKPADNPNSFVNKVYIPQMCGNCHNKIYQIYKESVHGRAVAKGIKDSPVCTDCHGEHIITPPEEITSKLTRLNIAKTCATCHEAETITRKYGLPKARYATYRESYHGIANRFGVKAVAECSSCHGVHNILPSTDPNSSIHKANLPKTCGVKDCHPKIEKGFTEVGIIHITSLKENEPIVYYIRLIYTFLIIFTIGGMLIHNALSLFRWLMDRRRKNG